ncbi:hypothetical protein Bhyg_16312 [Pseudolycoriella hygida]|uniref:Uncharacterized protein n=1 Tax=Pseudolycoriella hygida TaxID=35572 RepID=A0A9Q0RUF9_9DIPT|nr:hypothetical protein Bhyg_16312 [Pseudolycoriella hygida]
MLILNVLCASVIVLTAWAHEPYDELEIKIYDIEGSSLAEDLERNLKTVEHILTSDALTNVVQGATVIPVISEIASVISIAQDSLSDSAWKDSLVRAIEEHEDRRSMEDRIADMKACMTTIQQKIRILQNQNNLSASEKSTIVFIIENEISKMMNLFSASGSVFKKHVQFAYPALSLLTPIVAVFVPLMNNLAPELARLTFMTCKYNDILQDYRFLATVDRVKAVQMTNDNADGRYWTHLTSFVMSRPYNPAGYHDKSESNNKLKRGCHDTLGCGVCIRASGSPGYQTETPNTVMSKSKCGASYTYPAVINYIEEVRFRVEKAYNDLIALLSKVRPAEACSQRKATGDGWWTVFVGCATAKNQRNSDSRCDFGNELCEPYVKIYVDGSETFRTSTLSGFNGQENEKTNNMGMERDMACFGEVFTSKKLSKSASIKLELYDEDDGFFGGGDDILLMKEATLQNLRTNIEMVEGVNSVNIISIWKNEYNDD